MTRVFGLQAATWGLPLFETENAKQKTRGGKGAVETATAVEIDKGRLRRFLLDDSHKLFGKAFAKTASALPPLPQPRRRLSLSEEAITNKPPNTKFKLLPGASTAHHICLSWASSANTNTCRCFVGHPYLAIHGRGPALHFFKQPCSTLRIVHESVSLRLSTIHRDSRYRVLVSQIDSNENISQFPMGQSPFRFRLCFIPSQGRDWPFST